MNTEIITDTFETDLVKDLEVDISCAKVFFQTSKDSNIQVTAENLTEGRYNCKIKGNRLIVSYKCPGISLFPRIGLTAPEITLYLPPNFALERMKLEVGAGKVFMEEIPFSCQKIHAELGAGQWRAKQLSVTDTLSIETGAGNVRLENTSAKNLHLECGAGSCTFEGRIEKNMKIVCGVGNCRLTLKNRAEDFDYNVSCGLGKISVNGDKTYCGSKNRHTQGTAPGTAVLECGFGNIELLTKGEDC